MHKQQQMAHKNRRGGVSGAFLLVLCFAGILGGLQYIAGRQEAPNDRQRIAATLVSWGLDPDEMALPVDQDEIDRHIALLRSPLGEQRIQAAEWLACRGVRQAGPAMAAAMNAPGTFRPCQLAHGLGFLGDDRWVGTLVDSTKHRSNTDLRVCATLALGELASPKAVDALIDVYRRDAAPTFAVDALGRIADLSALPFLRSVARAGRNEFERRAAIEAIGRIDIMQQADPVPLLIERLKNARRQGPLDTWVVRKLAGFQDERAVRVLWQLFMGVKGRRRSDYVVLAAALLAHGDAGVVGLKSAAAETSKSGRTASAVARAALSLRARVAAAQLTRRSLTQTERACDR